jgi:hypothetical protein
MTKRLLPAACLLLLLCACGKDAPEYNEWIDEYTYDQVVAEWGEPEGCQWISDDERMCEWTSFSFMVADRRILLTFDEQGILRSAADARVPKR